MALRHITDDVLFVIIDALKIEDIIILGAASRRLRTVTTNERRVWAPRLLTKELGLGTAGLDAAACASLASLGCTPRRLLLQSLPWRPNRDSGVNDPKPFTWRPWRPRDVPAGLLLTTAQDLVICELYERDTRTPGQDTYSVIHDGFAHKVVRLTDCDLAGFPATGSIPLDIPIPRGHKNGSNMNGPWFELRLFALVEGALVPIADTGDMEGEGNSRELGWNSPLQPAQEYGKTWIELATHFIIDSDEQGDARLFRSVTVHFIEYERSAPPHPLVRRVNKITLQPGVDGFRQFFRRHAIRAQPDHMFATDSLPPAPFSLDGNWPERGLGGIDPNLDELPAAPMSVTWYGDRPQDWPDSD